MTPEVEENEITKLKSRMRESENMFKQHLQTYRSDRLEDQNLFKVLKDQNEQIILIVTPMSKIFEGSKFTVDAIIWILKFLGLLGAGIAAIIYLKGGLKP